jgi:hypothetical protein
VTCYLLCFINDEGEHVLLSDHAGHYLGETGKDVDERRDEHQAGRGAKLTAAAAAAGITFVVARTWPGRYPEERRLKGRRSGSRELKEKCPNCHPMPRIDRWAGGKPAWARKAETEPGHHEHRDQRHPAAVTPAPPRPAPPRPQADPYQRGVRMAPRFMQTQSGAGRTVGQIQATHEFITRPFREQPRHLTPAAQERWRGYAGTVTSRLAEFHTAGPRETRAQATAAEAEMEAD